MKKLYNFINLTIYFYYFISQNGFVANRKLNELRLRRDYFCGEISAKEYHEKVSLLYLD